MDYPYNLNLVDNLYYPQEYCLEDRVMNWWIGVAALWAFNSLGYAIRAKSKVGTVCGLVGFIACFCAFIIEIAK